jgi:hypothetical protein
LKKSKNNPKLNMHKVALPDGFVGQYARVLAEVISEQEPKTKEAVEEFCFISAVLGEMFSDAFDWENWDKNPHFLHLVLDAVCTTDNLGVLKFCSDLINVPSFGIDKKVIADRLGEILKGTIPGSILEKNTSILLQLQMG